MFPGFTRRIGGGVSSVNHEKPDANWWSFAIDGAERGKKINTDESAGTIEVNPVGDGMRQLSYHKYLGLDRLLSCQVPSSQVPDERIFIVTHQLFEIVFKQIIFDLRVIAETFRALLATGDAEFSELADLNGEDKRVAALKEFWGPALTAAARTRHGARHVIPGLMAYLATEDTFDNEEFAQKFRDNLTPASGFQSAQFRLIQRALGKSHLLDVRLFPADTYLKEYAGKSEEELKRIILTAENAGLVSVADRLILQEGALVATPPVGSPLVPVAELDDLAHKLLARIATLDEAEGTSGQECEVPLLPTSGNAGLDMEQQFKERLRGAVERRKKEKNLPDILTKDELEMIAKRGEVFGRDWVKAATAENRRRERNRPACRGAGLLLREVPQGRLTSILGCLSDADDALSGSFLLFHQKVVARRVGSVAGTAGGGVPYLDFARELIGLFPALVAFRAVREQRGALHKDPLT
jgi:tryptophan 2,3-dioxygenase